MVGISTLAALAWSADGGVGRTAAVIDARRGQVYVQQFQDGEPVGAPEAVAIESARDRLAGDDGRRVGSGAALVSDDAGTLAVLTTPSPAALAALTAAADPASAPPRPLYLRAPDATPPTRLPGQPRPARP